MKSHEDKSFAVLRVVFGLVLLGRSWRFASVDGFIRKHYPKFLGTW